MKANYTLFMLRRLAYKHNIFLYGCFAYLISSHSRQLALLQSMWMRKEARRKRLDKYSVIQYTQRDLILKDNYAHPAPWMLVWYGNDSQQFYATLRNVISIII